jgi:polygalacturonase
MKIYRLTAFAFILLSEVLLTPCGDRIVLAEGLRQNITAPADRWNRMSEILKRIHPPVFAQKTFSITRYGAVSGGADCSAAFASAIRECSVSGGGHVIVPEGTWDTGPIRLLSNVDLHLEKGATVRFSRDLKKYLPPVLTRYESVECMNYSPFIYAIDQTNIAVTGEGTLDGQAGEDRWWDWKRQEADDNRALKDMAKKGVPEKDRIFGEGHKLRVNFIEPYRCTNVMIDGITIIRSPMWCTEPVQCSNVIVRNITVNSHGPNNDGCDPQSCSDVLIEGCSFNTGDDCIAIKSGRDDDGRRLNIPCSDIVIRNCMMKDGHGGITLGSETSGSIRNVFAENCTLDSPELWMAIRLKTNSVRGGTIENINIRNIRIGRVRDAVIHATMYYEPRNEGDQGAFTPVIRNISISNVVSENSSCPVFLEGYERSKINDVVISGCDFRNALKEIFMKNTSNVTFPGMKINGKLGK